MAPSPDDGVPGPSNSFNGNTQVLPYSGLQGTISLATLIDFIVQKTYHELTVLAELLPRKMDLEKKKEIAEFASRTRQLFVRLLALVRWASSASKVEKCSGIMNFLDRQSMIFVETADALFRMARETLVNARLPNFHIPAAVEILTTGTYGKLPACIKDRIVPPEPITPSELKSTLKRLNQVIEHRLMSATIPDRMRQLNIENGRVTFTVDSEFQVSLTLMGDSPQIPWRLLEVSILVEDRENGRGKNLVNKGQTLYIHQMVQSRLYDNNEPLVELYTCLHAFCLSLQLDVLFYQVLHLCESRLGKLVRSAPNADYVRGRHLGIHYWLDMKDSSGKDIPHILMLQIDPKDSQMPLLITHKPPMTSQAFPLLDRVAKPSDLSIERLLMHTIQTRAKSRLLDLKKILEERLGKEIECAVHGTPPVLNVPLLSPCMVSEQLMITIDTYSGQAQAFIPQQEVPKNITSDFIQNLLTGDWGKVENALAELRFCVIQRRCEKTLQHLPVSLHYKLPLIFSLEHRRYKLGKHKILIKLHKHPNSVIVLDFKEVKEARVNYSVYMLSVKSASIDSTSVEASPSSTQMYLKVTGMAALDPFIMTHNTGADIVNEMGKRPADILMQNEKKKSKAPSYIMENLAHFVALCEERVPFVSLCSELSKKNMSHQGVMVEPPGFNFALRLLYLPDLHVVPKIVMKDLRERLLSATMRLAKGAKNWMLELVFKGRPVITQSSHEQGLRSAVLLSYEAADEASKVVESLITDWNHIIRMYRLAFDLGKFLESNPHSNEVKVKSFNYRRLIILYGPNMCCSATLTWRQATRSYMINFASSTKKLSNPHHIIRDCVEADFARNSDIAAFIRLLLESYDPLRSISKLHAIPHLSRVGSTVPFTLMVQSSNHFRLAFNATYCLDIRLLPGRLVSIKDGAHSCFDRSKAVEEFSPTQCLKSFLLKYADEQCTFYDRRSQSEDDNPPSPLIETDAVNSTIRGSPSQRSSFLQNPASPHSQGHYYGPSSVGNAFPLASPPSISHPAPSPAEGIVPSPAFMSQPSPGHFGQSPAVSFMGQDHFSPFSVPSPVAASPFSQSPGLPRPSPAARLGHSPAGAQPSPSDIRSRVLPLRLWAGANPTHLSHASFDALCTPIDPDGNGMNSPIERFLSLTHLRKHWHKVLQTEESLRIIPCNEPGVIGFQSQLLKGHLILDPLKYPTLRMKFQALRDYQDQFMLEELEILDEFFNSRLVTNPIRPSSLLAFGKLLLVPIKPLRDIIQIMKLEVRPGTLDPAQYRFSVSMCMTIPPGSQPIIPPGHPAIIVAKMKLLFFIMLKEIQPTREEGTPQTVLLPIVHDWSTNLTQVAEKRDLNVVPAQPLLTMAIQQLKRFAECGFSQSGLTGNDCSIFPAVRDLLMNLGIEMQPQMNQMSISHSMMMQGNLGNQQIMGNQNMMQNQVGIQNMYGQNQQQSGINQQPPNFM
ncbi:mediator of RNA polymerase II transcription subunit 14-like [Artemia franciscana]|nr:hypothetical protein QYM36_012336 [Artemia franciscana]KAK2711128.1 hypothetical protein QYM36_012336 [Artemia franciscana]